MLGFGTVDVMLKQQAARVLLACALALAASASARAQVWEDRAYVNVNLGFHLASQTFVDTRTPVIYDERASVTTKRVIGRGTMPLDVGAGVRVWKNLGLGVAYTQFSVTNNATLDAKVPHPILFSQSRFASVPVELKHSESAIHLLAVCVLPISDRMDLALSGGPTIMSVKRDLVTGIQIAEESPTFATVTIAKALVMTGEDRVFGGVGGADLTYFVTPVVGVGVGVRYLTGSDAGSLQLAVGGRLRLR
jgi:hypothetical protein